jgi:hypothetical protein
MISPAGSEHPDRVIQLCFCPPMDDRADPERHEVGCYGASFGRVHVRPGCLCVGRG